MGLHWNGVWATTLSRWPGLTQPYHACSTLIPADCFFFFLLVQWDVSGHSKVNITSCEATGHDEDLSESESAYEKPQYPGYACFPLHYRIKKLCQKDFSKFKLSFAQGMARDKRNCYQHTPNQLRRKCEAFLRSTQDFSGYLETVG